MAPLLTYLLSSDLSDWNIREQATKSDRNREQRLEFPPDPEIEQEQTDRHHRRLLGSGLRPRCRLKRLCRCLIRLQQYLGLCLPE